MSVDDQRWQAESDARTLAEAAAIRADESRAAAAEQAAQRLAAGEKKRAEAAAVEAAAMAKLAGGRYPSMVK